MFFSLRFIRHCAEASGKVSSGPVLVWSALFLLVTLQLSTTLRPLLGRSDKWIQVEEKRFFLEHWMNTAGESTKNANSGTDRGSEINPP
jgi:hypothetical protein